MSDEKLLRFIGLAMKAGKLMLGDVRAVESIRSGKAKLVLISKDASDNTKKKYRNMCEYRNLKLLDIFSDRNEFGQCIGRDFAVVAAVEDDGFAKRIVELAERVDE